jgi:hypothetical protein
MFKHFDLHLIQFLGRFVRQSR